MNRKKETLDDLLAIPEDKRTEADTRVLETVMAWLEADQEAQELALDMLRGTIDVAARVSVLQ